MLDTSYGFNNLLKQGHKHFSGFEQVVLKNINACKQICAKIKRSFGPYGLLRSSSSGNGRTGVDRTDFKYFQKSLKKMVVNHIDKIFVTSDAATILKELQVQHPAAKMLVMACKMQQQQCGDATNFTVTFAGELLSHAQNLIRMGLHPSQIILGYEQAFKKALTILNDDKLVAYRVDNFRDQAQVAQALKATISAKIPNHSDFFCNLIAKACINSLPDVPKNFDIDNIRVVHILGSSVDDSTCISGMVVKRSVEGCIQNMAKPKIAVYSCPLDTQYAQTKGTVLIQNATELLNYTKGQEDLAEKFVQKLVNANINVVVAGGSVADIVLHFLDKYKILVVRIMSKFQLRRISRAVRATILSKLDPPTPDETGTSDDVGVQQIASQKLVVFRRDTEDCKLSTIILRGSTTNILDDIERAIDDGTHVFRSLLRYHQFLPGAGCIQTILSIKLEAESKKIQGLDQYSYSRFAKAFQVFPRILAQNAGVNSNEFMPKIISANSEDTAQKGLNIDTGDLQKIQILKIYDHRHTKEWALRLAAQAAITILRIDQIIVAKPAGGPKVQQNKNWDQDV